MRQMFLFCAHRMGGTEALFPPHIGGSTCGRSPGVGHAPSPLAFSGLARGRVVPGPTEVGDGTCGVVRGLRDRLPGCDVERFGMGPAVVLGQDLTEGAGPVRDGAVADLAAGDR